MYVASGAENIPPTVSNQLKRRKVVSGTYVKEAIVDDSSEEICFEEYRMRMYLKCDNQQACKHEEEIGLDQMPAFMSPVRQCVANPPTLRAFVQPDVTRDTKAALDDVMTMFRDTPNKTRDITTFLQPPSPATFSIFTEEPTDTAVPKENTNVDPYTLDSVVDCRGDDMPFNFVDVCNGDVDDIELNDQLYHVEAVCNNRVKVLDLDGDLDDDSAVWVSVCQPNPNVSIMIVANDLKPLNNDFILPTQAIAYKNGACVFTRQQSDHSLSSVVSLKPIEEIVLVYYAVESLRLVRLMHEKQWTHGSLSLESFYLRGLSDWQEHWGEWSAQRTDGWQHKGLVMGGDLSTARHIESEGDIKCDAEAWVQTMHALGFKNNDAVKCIQNEGHRKEAWRIAQQHLEQTLLSQKSELKKEYLQLNIRLQEEA